MEQGSISDACHLFFWSAGFSFSLQTEEKAKKLSTLISEEILADIAL